MATRTWSSCTLTSSPTGPAGGGATYPPGVAPRTKPSTSIVLSERLVVSWWAWPLLVGAAAFLAAELAIGAFALRTWVTFAIAGALALLALVALSRIRIQVRAEPDGTVLHVDDARLPASAIAAVTVIDIAQRRELLGPAAEPLA